MKKILRTLLVGGIVTGFLTMSKGQSIYSTPYTFATIAGVADGNFGSNDGTNNGARFFWPEAIVAGSVSNLYVADTFNNTIRKLTLVGTNWVVTTIAGAAGNPGSADGTNSTALFNSPSGIAIDGSGNLFVADSGNDTIRELTPVGTNWIVTTIAGSAENPGNDDGTNDTALFYNPTGIAVDNSGNLYVADLQNSTIREITPVGTNCVVTTIAGIAENYGSADGVGTNASFDGPSSVALDSVGNLYVADADNNIIRKLALTGTNWTVSTIAGTAQSSGSRDGTNKTALFNFPSGVSVDGLGNIYVADTDNDVIRKVAPSGTNWVVSTIAGIAGNADSADGSGTNALFSFPYGITVDRAGSLYVADTENSTIRMGLLPAAPNLTVGFTAPDTVIVSWPNAGNYTLQTNSDLTTTNWVNYGGTITTTNGTNNLTITVPTGSLFFRLAN
ncbi:MAG TPA: NHL repeat-containing protein [Verrucomicrobiae bacterium]|nr:NHL repeat-containing protein [Verrucomicrobiae bacterium]